MVPRGFAASTTGHLPGVAAGQSWGLARRVPGRSLLSVCVACAWYAGRATSRPRRRSLRSSTCRRSSVDGRRRDTRVRGERARTRGLVAEDVRLTRARPTLSRRTEAATRPAVEGAAIRYDPAMRDRRFTTAPLAHANTPPPPSDPVDPLSNAVSRLRTALRRPSRLRPHRIAVIRLYGTIGGGARSAEWVETVRRLRRQRSVPAVVLDIDSPGGGASASDYLFLALQRLAAEKPLVAHVRGVGASGAYLAAMAARRIVVAPTSVVGSIGVISAGPRVPELLGRLGVRVEEHRAGRLKGMGAPWRDDTDEERAREQQLVDAIYDRFIERVAAGRQLSVERVRELATGEVWLGTEAVRLGLADEVGDLDAAIEVAAKLAGVSPLAAPVRLRRPLLARLADRFATRLVAGLADEIEARLSSREPLA